LVKLNELEYAKKLIFANVWYETYIAVINPKTGKVQYQIDCSNLVRQVDMTGAHDVLNGIAHDKEKDVFYITGKNWPLIFVVKLAL
jgi:glutamine cyclotransferase